MAVVLRVVSAFDERGMRRASKRLRDLGSEAKGFAGSWAADGQRVSRVMDDWAGKFDRTGSSLTRNVSLPMVAAAGLAVRESIKFESAFAGVEKTVSASEAELAKLSEGIRDMAKEIPASREQIAGVAEAAGQLGIKTPAIMDFTRTMVDLGETTNLSANDAATQLARLANITKMPQDSFDELGSSVVALGNNLATTEAEIVEIGLRIAGAGAQVGMTEPQILAIGAALSSVGIDAEAGGTAVSKTLIGIESAVQKGGKQLEQWAAVSGMSAGQFKKAWEKDAASAFSSVVTGLGKMESQGGSTLKVLEQLGITEVRQRDALLRASGAGDLLTRSLGISTRAWEENAALQDEAAKRYETTESKLKVLGNKVGDVGLELGGTMVPAMSDAVDAAEPLLDRIGKLAERFSELEPAQQRSILKWTAMAAGAGPALKVLGAMGHVSAGVVSSVSNLGLAFGENAAAAPAWARAIAAGTKGLKWLAGASWQAVMWIGKTSVSLAVSAYRWTIDTARKGANAIATVALSAAQKAAAIGTGAWTAAQWLLNAALTANPIGIVVVAVGALIAILVLAWKNSETFRRVVTAAFQGIKTVAMNVFPWLRLFVKDTGKDVEKTMATTGRNSARALGSGLTKDAPLVRKAGIFAGRQVAYGANSTHPDATTAGSNLTSAMNDGINKQKDKVKTAGRNTGLTFSNSLLDTTPYAYDAGRGIAQAIQLGYQNAWKSYRGGEIEYANLYDPKNFDARDYGVQAPKFKIPDPYAMVEEKAPDLGRLEALGASTGKSKKSKAAKKAADDAKHLGKIVGKNLSKALTADKATIKAKVNDLVKTLRALDRDKTAGWVKKQGARLVALRKEADKTTSRLKAAKDRLADLKKQSDDFAGSVRDNLVIDITSLSGDAENPGSIESIQKGLADRLAAVRAFQANLKKLAAAGLSNTAIGQIAQAGLGAGSQTAAILANATGSQIAQINALQADIDSSATAVGNTTANQLYGAGIRAAEGVVAGLKARERQIERQFTRIAERVEKAMEKTARAAAKKAAKKAAHGDGIGVTSGGFAPKSGLSPNTARAASTASRFGLKVSSGYRPGAITASGNPSLHGKRRAVDVVGSVAAKWRAFNYFVRNAKKWGLYEAINQHSIYKSGKGMSRWARNDHMDHLHLGFKFAKGAYVRAKSGGVFAMIGEGGDDEHVLNARTGIPILARQLRAQLAGVGGGSRSEYHFHFDIDVPSGTSSSEIKRVCVETVREGLTEVVREMRRK